MIKVQVFFLLHPRFSFACLFLVNFDSSDQVTGLAATVGKVSRQAFLQLAEGVQVASLDLTQTHPSLNPVMTCVLDTSWSCCQWQVKQVLPRKHNRMLPQQHHCQPHIHWMGLRSRTKNHWLLLLQGLYDIFLLYVIIKSHDQCKGQHSLSRKQFAVSSNPF